MPDIQETELHLPESIHIAPLEYVTEEFTATQPRIQNIQDIIDEGYDITPYLDDETIETNKTKSLVDIPQLTSVGPVNKDTFTLKEADILTIPVNAFNYGLWAIMEGRDPLSDIGDSKDVRLDNDGYTDSSGTVNNTFDATGVMVNQVETIVSQKFVFLAKCVPADPTEGDKYILGTKLVTNKEELMKTMQSDRYQETINLKSNLLNPAELSRWQNIIPEIKATTGILIFNAKLKSS